MNNKIKGKSGEDIAVNYLKRKGYEIIDRNYTTDVGEIDIVAAFDGYLIFIEVKERYSDKFGYAAEAVNYFKQNKISQVASQYINKYRMFNTCVRFDVIEVYAADRRVEHIENAFDSFLRY